VPARTTRLADFETQTDLAASTDYPPGQWACSRALVAVGSLGGLDSRPASKGPAAV